MTAAEFAADLQRWARTGVPLMEAARRLGLQHPGQSTEEFASEVRRRIDAFSRAHR